MQFTAWNNGSTGYGFKVAISDRDAHFDQSWDAITIELPTSAGFQSVTANIKKDSFWGSTCHELISKEIGAWLIDRGDAPWPKGQPPKFNVESVGAGVFRLAV